MHRTIEADPSLVRDQVAEALQLVAEPTALELRVNPADRDILEQAMPELVEQVGRGRHTSLGLGNVEQVQVRGRL